MDIPVAHTSKIWHILFCQEIMEKKQITPEIESAIKSSMDEPLGGDIYSNGKN